MTKANLTISPDKVFFIIVKAREFDAKEELSDPDSGSNPSDDKDIDILEEKADDPTFEELASAIRALNIDEQLDLLALTWIGRGDFDAADWKTARAEAAGVGHKHVTRYLVHTPLLSDYLTGAMADLGYDFEDLEKNRL
ncbi:MAG: DUF3775 domain-containing protein [Alphaproteobacteria bacterium]